MSQTEFLDIVALVNNNPLTKLSNDYGSKIISKIKSKFTDEDQQLFVANFYCYLNYNQKTDFVIILDRIWKWLGYSRIEECKRVLVKNFEENVHYKIEKAAPPSCGAGPKLSQEGKNLGGAGMNREYITLTVNCFKKLCLKSKTEKADQIHDYYVGLEELMNELVAEQTEELQQKLKIKEQNMLNNFNKKPIVYIGYTEKKVVKFGFTNNGKERLAEHKHDIDSNFTFEYIYDSLYNREIEQHMKKNIKISSRRISKLYPGKPIAQTELIQLDDEFTIKDLNDIILDIKNQVESKECGILKNNLSQIEIENISLKLQIEKLQKKDSVKFKELRDEIISLKLQIKNQEYELKKQSDVVNESNAKIENIQLNSMEDLGIKLYEIKKAVCYNFLIDLIIKNMNESELKLSIDEIFEYYKKFRISNRYRDPIYDETYEKSIITKAFNDVDGIKNTYKTTNGIQSRAKLFYINKIFEWICENIQVPKRFRSIFREVAKEIVFVNKFYKILNEEIDDKIKHVYSFLIDLLNTQDENFIIKNTILSEKYLKFLMQHDQKKLTMANIIEILKGIPGISLKQRISDGNSKYCKGLQFNKIEINEWIKENLEIKQ
jgi:predicted GIY-YIG superfamily endonuclease